MKVDSAVQHVSQDATYAVTVATQLFLELLVLESHQFTAQQGRKTVSYQDVAAAVHDIHEFEFLAEVVPMTMTYEEAMEKRRCDGGADLRLLLEPAVADDGLADE
ncbi:hypothetical protein HDU91_005446 [Kappamyces sp. JEL0680]|nr:hypothetical protein HDU91_005446 [Kappamyces sp. JEL0680]